MPLRIALTHAFSWPEVRRGGERYLHELAAALARRGHEVTIVAGARRPGLSRQDGVRVMRLARRPGSKTHHAEKRFERWVGAPLLAFSYDVVHSLGARDAAVSTLVQRIRSRRRTVYTNLGVPQRPWRDTRPDGLAHLRVVRDIDVYGCLSRYARSTLAEQYGRKGAMTPGGVNLKRFRPVADRVPEPTLLYSGALDVPRKGVAELLEAVALLAKSEPRLKLWLSGPGDPSGVLASAPAAAVERTEVLPMGRPEDQAERYAAAWATVLPSRFEAFGLVLIESLACGTPIVANDHGSLPELVEPGCGFLARAEESTDLAEACARAMGLAREDGTAERCRKSADRHDWDSSVAPALEDLYAGSDRDSGH